MDTTAFAFDGPLRAPTATEVEQGFPCGPADQTLFNYLFYRLQKEVGEVIDYAGLIGTDTDLTQLRQAIQQMILSALAGIGDTSGTPEIDTSSFLLINQARTRLPFFPEIQTGNNKLGVTSTGVGNVRIPSGVVFLHRGIFPVTTAVTDFATSASKTYHVRWNPTDGFTLKDIADTGYNPTVLTETNEVFDSTFDNMLVARVITNSSNIPTITDLANSNRLVLRGENIGPKGSLDNNTAQFVTPSTGVLSTAITQGAPLTFNFARRPDIFLSVINDLDVKKDNEMNIGARVNSRYDGLVWAQGDLDITVGWVARAF